MHTYRDSGVSGDYALTIVNSNTDYADRDAINATAIIDGVAFNFMGTKKLVWEG